MAFPNEENMDAKKKKKKKKKKKEKKKKKKKKKVKHKKCRQIAFKIHERKLRYMVVVYLSCLFI